MKISRLNSGNTCYVTFDPEFFVSPLLCKNVTREMYTSVFFLIVSYGCDSVSSHYERTIKLRVFEERVMKIVFEPEKKRSQKRKQKNANDELRAWSLSPRIVRFFK